MRSSLQPIRMTEAQYFAFEETAEDRHEWWDGEIFGMAGGSTDHNRVAGTLYVQLDSALRGKPCETFIGDVRVHIRARALYTYPDVMVVCGGIQYLPGRTDTVTNPTLIAEVLSDSTVGYDRGDKWTSYRTLESLQHYLLIDQTRFYVEHYERAGDTWVLHTYGESDDVLHIESLGIELPIGRFYERVEWATEVD